MTIIDDLASITNFAKYFGIVPMMRTKGDELEVIKYGHAYEYILALIMFGSSTWFCMLVLFNASEYKIMRNAQGNTEEINQTIETLFCIISYTMIVLSSVSNSSKYCRTLQDIGKIDEMLDADGYTGSYRCRVLAGFLGTISFSLLCVAFFYIHVRSELYWGNQMILLGVYGMQMLLSSLYAISIRLLLMNITRRITFVNTRLEEFTKDRKMKWEDWRQLSNLIEILCKFRYITENINMASGVSLLFYMGFAFYTVTNQSYLAFSTLTTHVPFLEKFDSMGLSIAWVFVEINTMSVICSSCDAVTSESNVTSQILARVYGKGKEYQNIVDKFLTKCIKQEVQFTAYGFFVIDNSTLFKIFSAVTTYLVILIQFKQLEDSNEG